MLRFQNQDGSWGNYTNLKGATGDSRWGLLGTNIYYTNGSVCIGTKDPVSKLTVNGSVTATAYVGDGSQLSNLPRYGKPVFILSNVYGWNASGSHDYYYNISSIPAANLIGDYLKIEITASSHINVTQNTRGQSDIDIRTKPISNGSYLVSMPLKHFVYVKPVATASISGSYEDICETNCIAWYHKLTPDEKANGIQVQIHVYLSSPTSPAGQYADFHNIQTILSAL
jgi:hypothetical protein